VPNQSHRKNANYAELYVGLLQNQKVFGAIPLTLNLALRHERVDPLFRSVAIVTQSDVERDGFDLGGNVDVVSVLFTQGRTDDNLDAIASLMTNRTRSSSVTLGIPLASLLRAKQGGAWWPTLTYAAQQMHQFGAGIPTGGTFTASDVPDQVTLVQDAGAQWQVKQWQFAYHLNESDIDNRQPGHELADFSTQTNGVTIGTTVGSTLTLGVDLGLERAVNEQLSQVSHIQRAGVTGNWRITPVTTLDGSVTLSRTQDPGAGSDTHVSAVQLGIAQGFNLWRSADATPRGQIFVRFSRSTNDLYNLGASFAPPTQSSGLWNVASGITLRLF
jgi:hypothetical protein